MYLTQQEAMDALRAASENSSFAGKDGVSSKELELIAEEMGIDRNRLREVIGRGTGTIESHEDVGGKWLWPRNETFERTISGEISEIALTGLRGELGSAMAEDPGQPSRIIGEYWSGWTYTTVEVVSQSSRTKIVARSRPSIQQLMPLLMIFLFGGVMSMAIASKKAVEFLPDVLTVWLQIGIIGWFLLGWSMRSNRDSTRNRLDRIARLVQEEISRSHVGVASEQVFNENLER